MKSIRGEGTCVVDSARLPARIDHHLKGWSRVLESEVYIAESKVLRLPVVHSAQQAGGLRVCRG